MTQDTPTLTPPEAPAPMETETPPAPAAPAETPPEPAAPEVEGAEGSTEPTVEAPPWANVTVEQGIEALFEIEDVKAFHEGEKQKARDEGYQTLQSHMQPTLLANQQQLSSIGESNDAILAALNKAHREGNLDADAVSDLMRQHKGAFAALNGLYQSVGFWDGVRQYVQGVAQATGDMALALPFLERLNRMQYSTQADPVTGERKPVDDPAFLPDFVKKLTDKARKEGDEAGYKRGLKEKTAAQAEQLAAQQRRQEGANLTPGASGGQMKKYSEMTAEERAKLTSEERDAAVAREGFI